MNECTAAPGSLRIRTVNEGGVATAYDVRVEVKKENGTWLALGGITKASIELRPDSLVGVKLDALISSLDLTDIPADWVKVETVVLPS
jgi:hypothetical protein